MTFMKKNRFASIVAALVIAASGAAHAQDAAPNTLVTNSVSMSYTSGGNTINNANAASVAFRVDRKIDLNVSGLNAGNAITAQQAQNVATLSYLVDNLGNSTTGFDLEVAATGSMTMVYDGTTPGTKGTYYVVVSDNATPGSGTETAYNPAGIIRAQDVAAKGKFYVHIYANIRNDATDGQAKSFNVTARAMQDASAALLVEDRTQGALGIDTVFADPGTDGLQAASQSMTVSAPNLSVAKTNTVISENLAGTFDCETGTAQAGAAAFIPGACVEYVITVSNGASSTAANNISVSDPLPAGMTYVGHSKGTFTSVSKSGNTLTGQLTSLAANSSASFKIRARIGS
jgi:uncharacterized repeat protein (TIGR01451 family)